jgi:hypothetical protein
MTDEEERIIGHAEHFLTRLDRLNTAERTLLVRQRQEVQEVLQRSARRAGAVTRRTIVQSVLPRASPSWRKRLGPPEWLTSNPIAKKSTTRSE